jgi:thiol-disulfide isomerase/thioredoxin
VLVRETQLRRLATGIICICVLLVAGTSAAVAFPRFRELLGFPVDSPAYRVGDVVDVPPETYERTPHSLIVFARASCAACQAARPILAELVEKVGNDSDLRIVLLMPSVNPSEGLDYVRGLGLPESSFIPRQLREFKVRAVPTAVLVDQRGKILAVSEGFGDPFHALTQRVVLRVNAF